MKKAKIGLMEDKSEEVDSVEVEDEEDISNLNKSEEVDAVEVENEEDISNLNTV